jgi:hypothetical protein
MRLALELGHGGRKALNQTSKRHGLALVLSLTGIAILACSSNKTVYVECAGAAACYQESCAIDPSSPAGCAPCSGSITDFTGNQTDVCGNVSAPTSCKYNSSCSLFAGVAVSYAYNFTPSEYRGTFTLGACKYTISGSRLDQCPILDAGVSDTSTPDSSKSQCDRSALCTSGCCAQHQCIAPTTTSACACLSDTDCYKLPCEPNGCAQGVTGTPSCNVKTGLCSCSCG